ncbi:maleylpyruvate isomerase family mycothiol-dependent enzyme [Nocardioides sp. Soil805]|uniref:maleylpyruvate isomerase family mycothiol-dependent enzyme n=1 Tax=Nocardioides sp. Soil805 TaxID=1736416 RepID=UPI0007034753|nr:maleylpyruvate isomerase family mycothiol-dependent enzyme [Nocardioides sp. Soil805]KRF30277.1 hypothetical protein ASG94_19920 [Nocardioides sp. Soil805]
MNDIWTLVAAERGALAADLAGLSEEQWETPSLCEGWSVRDTVAHMTNTAHTGPGGFLVGLARARFDFDRFLDAGIARRRGASGAEALAEFRDVQHSRTAPPGPRASWLGETVVHAEDVRRPLGIEHDYAPEAVRRCLDFFKSSNTLIGTERRIDGVALRATDQEWAHGSGPGVEGRAIDLLLAATGRAVGCDRLTGDGVSTLRSRC